MWPLTPAAVGSVVPVSRGTLPAAGAVDSGLTGALAALRVAGLGESGRGVAVALTAATARVVAERAVLRYARADSGGEQPHDDCVT